MRPPHLVGQAGKAWLSGHDAVRIIIVIIEHPENIAFDPVAEGVGEFYVLSGPLRLFSTFEAVTSVTLVDAGGEAASA